MPYLLNMFKFEPGLTGERKTKKARETRARILQAALHLFQTQGYDRTTMREIARDGDIALGASYYYFKNKQELVLAFYAETQAAAEEHLATLTSKKFTLRQSLTELLEYRLKLLEPYKSFLSVLTRHVDPKDPISPFSRETGGLRNRAIQMIEGVLTNCRKPPSKTISHQLSVAVWLFQIGLVFFWLHDRSRGKKQTGRLIQLGLNAIQLAIRMSGHSVFRPVNRSMKELIEIIERNFI